MKRKYLFLLPLITTFFCCAEIFAQQTIVPTLTRDTILIGDQVKWSAGFKLNEETKISYLTPENPFTEGVEIIGKFSLDTLSNRKGELSLEANMIITSFDSGSYLLPPVIFELVDKDGIIDSIVVSERAFEVNTVQIDTASFKPFDIKGQIKYKLTFREIYPWILGLLLLIVMIWLLYRYRRNNRNNRDIWGRERIVDPPHIVALRELERIRNGKMWQNGKEKEYYTAITEVLRSYIESRFKIQAMESTSNEIILELEKERIEKPEFEDLKQLFAVSDLVKFAKYSATQQENENAVPIAVRFVNVTFLQQMDEDNNS